MRKTKERETGKRGKMKRKRETKHKQRVRQKREKDEVGERENNKDRKE